MPASRASPPQDVGGLRRAWVRIRGWWRRFWWLALAVAGGTAFLLALLGAKGSALERLNTALLLLPVGFKATESDVSTPLQIARILAPIVFAYATLRIVFALFSERLQDVRAGFMKGHTIVCGLGDQGQSLVESMLGSTKVVALEVDPANLAIRRLRDAGAVVLVGDATDPEVFRRAHGSSARHVVAVCGRDAVNAQVGANILELEKGPRASDVFIHVADPRLYTFLLHHSFTRPGPRLEFFNLYERGARRLVEETYGNDGGPDVVLVAGAGQLGLALISQLTRERYFLREVQPEARKLQIHLVDKEARSRARLLTERFSRFRDVCELQPEEIDVDSPAFDRLLDGDPKLAEVEIAFVCFDDDGRTVATTLNLLDQARGAFPVVARVTHRSEGIAGLIAEARSRYAEAADFRPLSLAQACRAEVVLDGMRGDLARQVHESYRQGDPGGPYDAPWEDLPEELHERNLRHADALTHQLENVGYRLGPLIDWGQPLPSLAAEEVERMAELEHERWVEERLSEGWVYSTVRDDAARAHPDLVPWSELSDERRDINRRLVRERPAMLARVGVEIYHV